MFSHPPRAVRRHALSTSCLLAFPTAFALGGSAQAQTVISANQSSTLNLSSYGAAGVSISNGVSITSTGLAAVSATVAAQLGNAGQVSDMSGSGIDLGAGGAVSNSGSINGADYGVRVNGAAGQVSNTGAIAAGYDGVSLNKGGIVSNSGSIFGAHIGVYTGNGQGSVSNSGTITARSGDAVSLYSGGSLTNTASGQLNGGYSGVYAGGNGSQITNAGLITGPEFGAYLMGASSVSNSGTMAGGVDGVMDLGAGGVVANTGLIHGGQIGVRLAGNGSVDNSGMISGGTIGVKLGVNGTLANEASGHVTGGTTSVVAAAGDVLTNAGSISGRTGISTTGAVSIVNTGVISSTVAGGNAISLSGGASTITLGTGSQIDGNIAANNTASQIILTGSGTLACGISGFAAGSALTVAQGAVWTGEGNWQVAQLVNNGVFTPGLVGTPLSLSGNFVQNSTGTLRVLVTPGGISSFAITGTATLGGTLRYVLAPGTYAPGSDTFLTASGGIQGDFAQVTSTQTGLQATPLVHTVGSVVVVNGATTQVALTITAPLTVTPGGATLFADSTQAMVLGAFAAGASVLDRADSGAPAGGWAQASGSTASASGAYSVRGGGFLAGIDHGNGFGGRIGFAVGLDSSNMRDKSSGTAGLKTVRLGLYAAQPLGRFVLSADVMDGVISRNTTRTTGADAATAKGSANVLSGDAQLALPLVWGGADIVPAFGLRIASVTAGRLDEASATQAYALNVAGASGTTIAPYLRLAVQKSFITTSNLVITPTATLGVTTMLNNPGADTMFTAQDGTAFLSHPEHMAPISGQFSTGVTLSRGAWSFTATYSGEAGGNWSGQSLQAGVQARF